MSCVAPPKSPVLPGEDRGSQSCPPECSLPQAGPKPFATVVPSAVNTTMSMGLRCTLDQLSGVPLPTVGDLEPQPFRRRVGGEAAQLSPSVS